MKKSVLHVSAGGLSHGGVGSVIFSIVQPLYEQYDFGCVVFSVPYENEALFEQYGNLYRINCYPTKGKRDYLELLTRPFKLYFGIRKICKNNHFDIVHCHNQADAFPCLLAAKHARVPMRISHAHVGRSFRKKGLIEKLYKRFSHKLVSSIATDRIACSQEAGELIFGDKPFDIVYNSTDLERFSSEPINDSETKNFIHVGRFNYAKNQEFVIETFKEISDLMDNVHLFLVGYGTKEDTLKLEKMIHDLGLDDKVDMVRGDIVDVAEVYKKSEYMIFPSRFEGFGTVLVEAQAAGLSCYVSERILQEINCGALTYLNLSDGAKKWAEVIVADIKSGNKKTCNKELLLRFGEEEICKQYAALYNGEKL